MVTILATTATVATVYLRESRAEAVSMAASGSISVNGVAVAGQATPGSAAVGEAVSLTASVKSASAQQALVDVEVYDPTGKRVFQMYWDDQELPARRLVSQAVTWTVPERAAGTYRVVVGVFAPGWGDLRVWHNRAAVIDVGAATKVAPPPAAPGPPITGNPATSGFSTPGTAPPPAAASGPRAGSRTASANAGPSATASSTSPNAPPGPSAGSPLPPPNQPAPGEPAPAKPTPGKPAPNQPGPKQPAPNQPAPAGAPAHFGLVSVGAALPSGEQCAAWVRAAPTPPEVKGGNASANATTGRPIPRAWGPYTRVDGAFTGTTEQILRWAACKWGVDEDVVKAHAAIESWWRMDTFGDWGTDARRCPPGYGIGYAGEAGRCPESFGVLQIRYPYYQPAFPYASTSTAFNADYAYATWRDCYDGNSTWLNTVERGAQYAAGDSWGCLGTWFSGRWHTPAAEDYITRVQGYLDERIWTTADFEQP